MTENGNERFDVYFAGECLDGHDPGAVRAALKKLFRAEEETLDRLFAGHRQRLKRGCDKATALTYQKAMTGAGARPIITRASPSGAAADPEAVAAEAATGTAQADRAAPDREAELQLEVAPEGSDVLRPDERPTAEAQTIVTDHLSVADTGTDLSDGTVAPEAAATAPDLDIADLGSNLAPARVNAPPPPPDVSAIELTPPGYTLEDCAPAPADTPELSLEHLEMAPAGTELAVTNQPSDSHISVPDTSHLTLVPSADHRD